MFAKDIFVAQKDYANAKQLIENYKATNTIELENKEEENEYQEYYKKYKKRGNKNRIVAIIIFAVMFGLPALLILIASIFNL